ncbi:MAG: hypothetical protein K9L17_01730 [Clostridiales bacterium]|nr:hypothetical protein [Clostridiales bacterium]MCF8021407.1 hypothetical protein [Clostridiales bacterium]
MPNTVICTFQSQQAADQAVNELRNNAFDNEISVLSPDKGQNNNNNTENAERGDNVGNGTGTGGVLGGAAGLALGAGALAIPGLGPIIAAGPIAGLLSGVAAGGIAGGLVDYGIPKERSEYYEQQIQEGDTLVSVKSSSNKVNDAAEILRGQGGQDVEVH